MMMDLGPSATVFAPVRIGLEVVLAPTATPTCQPRSRAIDIRQAASVETCGFIGGDPDNPVTCGSSLYCATTSTYVGCCESTNCVGLFTTCYDLLGNSCDASCQNNPENLVCPTALPYCALYNYEGGSVGYGCAQDRGFTTTVLLTTKQTLGQITTSSSTPTTSPISTSTPSPTPEPASSGSSLGGGAIAGIVIGAVAVLAFIVFGIWFMRRRKSKKTAATTPSYTHVAREETSPEMQDRHTVASTAFSDSTTAYALPSPRTDAWKQSWQSQSDQDSSYAAAKGYSTPRIPPGSPGFPAEMPAPESQTAPSELDGSTQTKY
ncbi:uncharacterized protein A1O9_01109 [Exophiala aquamarina CBS 119918]|uniref:Mid2 domain-containing protein n=1 Tax=Exophiala aquamarina CBS 119918 TaxID=1182545 RepID=A0A072PUU2_9EURO|nr:uncharacterized protein A1O9_01109 [Exophiala aquamarina CBS 119918]KEF63133.1 hypothetical protein A1O9_01109 [Exophiala aquamarina CBS 119918]